MSSKTKLGTPPEATTPEQAEAILKAEAERKQKACAAEVDAVLAKWGMTMNAIIALTPDGRVACQGIAINPKPAAQG